jgi:hypothetical protein
MSNSRAPSELTGEELELWNRVHELWELSAQKDHQRIREALHPEYMGWDMSTPLPHDREAAVQSASGDSARLVQYDLEPLSVRVYGGSTGVVHYRYEAVVEPGTSQRMCVSGKWTEVYARHGLRWLMVAVSGQPGPPADATGSDTQST